MADVLANPQGEAKGMLKLLAAGESIESLRASIAADSKCPPHMARFREQVRHFFDLFLQDQNVRQESKPIRQESKPIRHGAVPRALRAKIETLLRAGIPHKQISARLAVAIGHVSTISKGLSAASWRTGRGRRLSDSEKQRIRQAVLSHRPCAAIGEEFHIAASTIARFRREIRAERGTGELLHETAQDGQGLAAVPAQRRKGSFLRNALPRAIRVRIECLLRDGLTHKQIYEKVPVSMDHIAAISKQLGVRKWPRNRRFAGNTGQTRVREQSHG